MLFSTDIHFSIFTQKILPAARMKIVNEAYKGLSLNERTVYENMATNDKMRYQQECMNFTGITRDKKVRAEYGSKVMNGKRNLKKFTTPVVQYEQPQPIQLTPQIKQTTIYYL
jgi:hypothetical protein